MTVQIVSDFVSMVQRAHAPRFTRQLSFAEQRQLSPADMEAYCEWYLSRPFPRQISEQKYLDRDYRPVGSIHDFEWSE